MGWEVWTHRRRRVAGLITHSRVPLFDRRYELPYLGRISPFPSDYVLVPWAPFMIEPIRAIFPGSFVDVGSNVGQTMLFIKHCDPDWDYVGFEPNPVSFVVSNQLAEANGLKSYCLVPAGLSDHAGLLQMESNFATDPAATVINGFRAPDRMKLRSRVTVVHGDDALAQVGCDRVGILKIDVEGGELEVVRGLRGHLASSRPLIICEVLNLHDGNSVGDFRVHRQRELERILREHRFTIYRIEPPGTVRAIPEVPADRSELVDFFFVPDERQSSFASTLASQGFVVA